jgi:hypothetical protein
MAGAKPPDMQVGQPIAIGFDERTHPFRHAAVWVLRQEKISRLDRH